jgi:hypothetical protein
MRSVITSIARRRECWKNAIFLGKECSALIWHFPNLVTVEPQDVACYAILL